MDGRAVGDKGAEKEVRDRRINMLRVRGWRARRKDVEKERKGNPESRRGRITSRTPDIENPQHSDRDPAQR